MIRKDKEQTSLHVRMRPASSKKIPSQKKTTFNIHHVYVSHPQRIQSAVNVAKSQNNLDYDSIKEVKLSSNYYELMIARPSQIRPQIIINRCETTKIIPGPKNPTQTNIQRKASMLGSQQFIARGDSTRRVPMPSFPDVPSKTTNRLPEESEDEKSVTVKSNSLHEDPMIPELSEQAEVTINRSYQALWRSWITQVIQNNQAIASNKNIKTGGGLLARGKTFIPKGPGITNLIHEKFSENESTKKHLELLLNINKLTTYNILFFQKMFTDFDVSLWTLKLQNITLQFQQKYLSDDEYDIISEFDDINRQLRNLLEHNPNTKAITLVCLIEISHHSQKMQFRFCVENFLQYISDITEPITTMSQLFNQLLKIELTVKGLYKEWSQTQKQPVTIYVKYKQQHTTDHDEELISRVLFLISKNKYVKKENGYKFKSQGIQYDQQLLDENNLIFKKRQQQHRDNHIMADVKVQLKVQKRQTHKKHNILIAKRKINISMHSKSSSQTPAPFGNLFQEEQTPMRSSIQPSFETPNWKQPLEDVFSLETQDFLAQYFPDFKLRISDYVPGEVFEFKRKQQQATLEYFPRVVKKELPKLEYQLILPKEYLVMTTIVIIDSEFYLINLSDKLRIRQMKLVNNEFNLTVKNRDSTRQVKSNLWQDEIDYPLTYKVGRTNLILDKVHLQEQLRSQVIIQNCRVAIKQEESPDIKDNLQLLLNTIANFRVYEYIERNPTLDLLFILSLNKRVRASKALNYPFLEFDGSYLSLKQNQEKKKLRFPTRLVLSYEDINKHVSRTNEQTIINENEVSTFNAFNSILIFKNTNYNYQFKIRLDLTGSIKEFKKQRISGQLSYCQFKIPLTFKQLEKILHALTLQGPIQEYQLKSLLNMKVTLIGRKLRQNPSSSTLMRNYKIKKDIYTHLQGYIKSQKYFYQETVKGIGKVFVTVAKHADFQYYLIQPQLSRTKAYIFVSQQENICPLLRLIPTRTYHQLFMEQVTTNTNRKQYLIKSINSKIVRIQNRVIYKQVTKFDKHYYLITITRTDCFRVDFYNQSNCRHFTFNLSNQDFKQMSNSFLDRILPNQEEEVIISLFKPWKLSEINKIYGLLLKSPDLFKSKNKNISNIIDRKNRRSRTFMDSKKVLHKTSTLQVEVEERNRLFDILYSQKYSSSFEKKLWSVFLSYFTLIQNHMYIDTVKVKLIEVIWSCDLNINFTAYIQCTETYLPFRWQPTRVRVNHKDIPLTCRGKQYQMVNFARQQYEQILRGIYPIQQDYIKINKTPDQVHVGYQLLYKAVFTKIRMQMIAVFRKNETIIIRVWHTLKYLTRKIAISQIEMKIPYIYQLLEINGFEAGRRIHLTYKNSLIHAAFINL